MNTYSAKLERIARELPEYESALNRFSPHLANVGLEGQTTYSLSRLFGMLDPESLEQLKGILLSLEREGVLKRILRIDRGTGPIQDFSHFGDIPNEIIDPNTDEVVHITPDDIKLYYRFDPQ